MPNLKEKADKPGGRDLIVDGVGAARDDVIWTPTRYSDIKAKVATRPNPYAEVLAARELPVGRSRLALAFRTLARRLGLI